MNDTENILILEGCNVPKYATDGSAGFDIPTADDHILYPGQTLKVRTGLYLKIPDGYELQIRPRSSASLRGILIHAGTIDSDYIGEICVITTNISKEILSIKKDVCYAQGILATVAKGVFVPVDFLPRTERGANGFGSTDK